MDKIRHTENWNRHLVPMENNVMDMQRAEMTRKWLFSKEQLDNTPSRKDGINPFYELTQRQQAAHLIRDIGIRLKMSQLCINTAIVFMHRFYMYHSLAMFHRNTIAITALFLANKVTEQMRRTEDIVNFALPYIRKHNEVGSVDKLVPQRRCLEELLVHEGILLTTLGFEQEVIQPNPYIVAFGSKRNVGNTYVRKVYELANCSFLLTTMCLRYKPKVIACFCYHLVSRWSKYQIPDVDGMPWYASIEATVSNQLLEQMVGEFLDVVKETPARYKKHVINLRESCIAATESSPEIITLVNPDTNVKPNGSAAPATGNGYSESLLFSLEEEMRWRSKFVSTLKNDLPLDIHPVPSLVEGVRHLAKTDLTDSDCEPIPTVKEECSENPARVKTEIIVRQESASPQNKSPCTSELAPQHGKTEPLPSSEGSWKHDVKPEYYTEECRQLISPMLTIKMEQKTETTLLSLKAESKESLKDDGIRQSSDSGFFSFGASPEEMTMGTCGTANKTEQYSQYLSSSRKQFHEHDLLLSSKGKIKLTCKRLKRSKHRKDSRLHFKEKASLKIKLPHSFMVSVPKEKVMDIVRTLPFTNGDNNSH